MHLHLCVYTRNTHTYIKRKRKALVCGISACPFWPPSACSSRRTSHPSLSLTSHLILPIYFPLTYALMVQYIPPAVSMEKVPNSCKMKQYQVLKFPGLSGLQFPLFVHLFLGIFSFLWLRMRRRGLVTLLLVLFRGRW